MKKFIAVLLSVLCIFSIFTIAVNASSFPELKEDGTANLYRIVYDNNVVGVKLFYKPNPSIDFDKKGYVTVTSDTPIAVNHEFVCWKDADGNLYYEGDKVYVDGVVTLYAVWEEKTDNYPEFVRTIRCGIVTLERLILKIFGVFKDLNEFVPAE